MIPELEERKRQFEAARQEIHELVEGLDDEGFNRRTDESRWSIAECVDHLIVVGGKMVPRLAAAVEEGRRKGWSSDGPFAYGPLGNWFVRQMGAGQLPPRKRLKVPRLYVPRPATRRSIDELVAEFTGLQDRFIAIANGADGLDLRRIKVTSPVTRLIRLSLGQWLEGLAGHQRRHLWQAEQLRAELSGRA